MSGKIEHYNVDLVSVFAELLKKDIQDMVGKELADAALKCDRELIEEAEDRIALEIIKDLELPKKKRHMKKSKYWKGKK